MNFNFQDVKNNFSKDPPIEGSSRRSSRCNGDTLSALPREGGDPFGAAR